MKFSVKNVFHCDEPTYWDRVFFDPEYNERLYREVLGFSSFEILENTGGPGEKRVRVMRTEPAADAPAVVRKLVGDSLSYTERGEWDPGTGVWTYGITLSALSDKVHIGGTLWAEPRPEGVERIVEVDVDVKIFGVGGTIERFVEKTTRDSYVKTARFTNEYIREKGLGVGSSKEAST